MIQFSELYIKMNLQEVLAFSNQKLFDELKKRGANVGPVTDGTKNLC